MRLLSVPKVRLALAGLAVVTAGAVGALAIARPGAIAPAEAAVKAQDGRFVHLSAGQGQARKAWLGVVIANLNDSLAQRLGLSQTGGVVITKVMPDGPGAQAGLQDKDTLTQVGATAVADVKAVHEALKGVTPGDTVSVTVQRGEPSASVTVQVTTGEAPKPPKPPKGPKGPARAFGLGMLPFPLAELEGIPPGEMFSHFVGAQYTVTDKDGNPVTISAAGGSITSVDSSSLTIQQNGNAGAKTYAITTAKVLGKGGKVENLAVDEQVVVVTVGSGSDARYIMTMPQIRKGRAGSPQPQSFTAPFAVPAEPGLREFPREFRERLEGLRQRTDEMQQRLRLVAPDSGA